MYSSDKKLLGTFSLNHMEESKDRLLDSDEAIQKQSFAHFVQDYNISLFKRSHSTQQVNGEEGADKNDHNLSEQQPNQESPVLGAKIQEEGKDEQLRIENSNSPDNTLPGQDQGGDSTGQRLTKEFKKQNFKISIEECKSPQHED